MCVPVAYANEGKKAAYNKKYYQNRKKARHEHADERKLNLSVRLPESLVGRLHRLVNEGIAMGKFPWKTMSECVKTLLLDGLRSRKGDDTISEFLPHLEAQAQLDRVHSLRREAQGLLNKARQEVQEMIGIGARDDAVRYFHVTLDAARKLPATVWRDWLVQSLLKEFPELAKAKVTGVTLLAARKPSLLHKKGRH